MKLTESKADTAGEVLVVHVPRPLHAEEEVPRQDIPRAEAREDSVGGVGERNGVGGLCLQCLARWRFRGRQTKRLDAVGLRAGVFSIRPATFVSSRCGYADAADYHGRIPGIIFENASAVLIIGRTRKEMESLASLQQYR